MRQIFSEKIEVVFEKEPKIFVWRRRKYWVKQIGLHHTYRQGRKLMHVYSLIANNLFFRLELDSESLDWKLTEIADGLPD